MIDRRIKMNNGEWLNTLSNEEKAKVLDEEWGNIDRTWEEWLNEEHEPTGHERLIKAGWTKTIESYEHDVYAFHYDIKLKIPKEEETEISTCGLTICESECKFLFECADEIRKEKGWV